jgi:hypothetical protein
MNAVQIHLMLNHIPVLAPLLAAVLVAIGMTFRSQPILRVALVLLMFGALMAIPVYLTGDPVEHVVEGLPGVREPGIEQHEAAALWSMILLGALGLTAAVGMTTYRSRPLPRGLAGVVLVGSLVVAGHMAWTAHLGGQIRHTELRGATETQATPVSPADDDD